MVTLVECMPFFGVACAHIYGPRSVQLIDHFIPLILNHETFAMFGQPKPDRQDIKYNDMKEPLIGGEDTDGKHALCFSCVFS